jgi:hypothetical protein
MGRGDYFNQLRDYQLLSASQEGLCSVDLFLVYLTTLPVAQAG